jgi:hypothetical protein
MAEITVQEMMEWMNTFEDTVADLAPTADTWNVKGFVPEELIKVIMGMEKNAGTRTADMATIIAIMLSFGNIHDGNVKRRMGDDAGKLLSTQRAKYGIMIRTKKGAAIPNLTNVTVTLPRIMACFPFIAASLLFKKKVKACRPGQYFISEVNDMPDIMKFSGFPSLLNWPFDEKNSDAQKQAGVVLYWASAAFCVSFDRMINPEERSKAKPKDEISNYVDIAMGYSLGKPANNLKICIDAKVIDAHYAVNEIVLKVARECVKKYDRDVTFKVNSFSG